MCQWQLKWQIEKSVKLMWFKIIKNTNIHFQKKFTRILKDYFIKIISSIKNLFDQKKAKNLTINVMNVKAQL